MKCPVVIRRFTKKRTVGWWNGAKWTTKCEEAVRYSTTELCPETLPLFPGVVLIKAVNFYVYGGKRWAVIEKDLGGYDNREWDIVEK